MTAPVSRDRLAEIRAWHERAANHPGGNIWADLLATAEWGWAEHDRAERLEAEVRARVAAEVRVNCLARRHRVHDAVTDSWAVLCGPCDEAARIANPTTTEDDA